MSSFIIFVGTFGLMDQRKQIEIMLNENNKIQLTLITVMH